MGNELNKKSLLALGIIILIVFILGIFLYSQGYLDNLSQYLKKIIFQSNQTGQVFKVLGRLISVNTTDKTLTIEAYQTSKEITLSDGRKALSTALIKVKVNDQTQITKVKNNTQNLPNVQRTTITLDDIGSMPKNPQGDFLEITSNEDIINKTEITAKNIELLVQ